MNTSRRVTVSVIFTMAVLILAVVALQDYHFDGRNYRQDEMILVHNGYAESISRVVQLGGINAGHPLGWQIVTTIWIKSTGYAEPAARHLSTLVTMITLALVFRFGSDLVDWQTGLYATFILGTLAFGMFYMHEFRPNPALVMATIGMEFAFLRWSYHPGFKYALLYVIFGVIGLQSHYFACYVLAAQAVRFVLLVRWNKPIYLRAFGLFAAVGLSACAWILPFIARMLTTGGQSNVLASNARFFEIVYQQMQIRPTALGYLLLPLGVLLPITTGPDERNAAVLFRFGAAWRKLFVISMPLIALGLAFVLNIKTDSVTTRNLMFLLPPLALVAALGMRGLPWRANALLIVLILIPAVTDFRVYRQALPLRQTLDFIAPNYQPGDRLVLHINKDRDTRHVQYYLTDTLKPAPANEDFFHIGGGVAVGMPEMPINWVHSNDPAAVQRFVTYLDDAEQVWYIEHRPISLAEPFKNWLDTHYAAWQRAAARQDNNVYIITRYHRLPANLQPLYRFGDAVTLQAWDIPGGVSVTACQTTEIKTWWRADSVPPARYGIGVVLADATGQGVVRANGLPSGIQTDDWIDDSYHLDTREMAIPCDLPPGEYDLLVGLYDYTTTEPLPIQFADGTPLDQTIAYLTTLTVTE